MSIIKPRTPSGFLEYLPNEQIEFNRLLDVIRGTYERHGFSPIDTPDLELSEVLLTKSGGETEQQIYRFEKGSNDLTMRFDLTVPLARYVAEHESDLVFPFRRYHIGKVHRGERAQAGRFREFYQCDIDIIGTKSLLADAEMPAIINDIFSQLKFGDFTIWLNNRKILNGFFELLNIGENAADVLRLIDKIDKISHQQFVDELGKLGLGDEAISKLEAFIKIEGSNDFVLEQLRQMAGLGTSEIFNQGVDELAEVIDNLHKLGVPEERFKINLKIARGLDYYTGTIYETTLNQHPELGSICSGGRYDNLAEFYTKTHLPGVGISIGLTRLFYKLRELGIVKANKFSPSQVLVMPFSSQQTEFASQVANSLRASGINTMLYTEDANLKKKFKFADKIGVDWVILIGEDEQNQGKVNLKNMQTGQAELLAVDEAASRICA